MDEKTHLAERIQELSSTLTQRSVLVILSDLHDPGALNAIRSAAVRHDVIVIQLQDPIERSRLGSGFIRTREAETGRQHLAKGERPWEIQETIMAELRKAGVDHLTIATDRPLVAPLRRFLFARGLASQASR